MLLVLKMDEVARGKEMDYQLEHLEGNINDTLVLNQ